MKLFKTLATSFESFDQTIRTYLIKTLGAAGEKYSKSQIFSIIFEGIKGVMQNVMFYIEDAFTEQNIETAYRKTSIYSLAKLSGYEPFYGSAATGIVDLSVPLTGHLQNNSTKIYIRNKSTLLNNSNGLYYSVEIPTDFYVIDVTKPLSKYQLKVVQGVWKTATYSSFGDPLEAIHVSTSGMYDNEYISVTVDGQEYTRVYNLYDMSENGLEYFVNVGYDNEFDVIFGNGIYGKQLNENQIVVISYLSHTGVEGNINVDDKIDFVFQTTIFDDNGDSIDTQKILKFSLSTPISGGSNSETIEVVRNMVGYNSRSLVLANENNFRLFFRRFSFVGQTNIWCEKNSLVVNAVCLSNYKHEKISYTDYFNAYSNGKLLLTQAQKDMIITTLNNSNKTFAGVTLNFIDPIIYK